LLIEHSESENGHYWTLPRAAGVCDCIALRSPLTTTQDLSAASIAARRSLACHIDIR
jgi:hypothetical protein